MKNKLLKICGILILVGLILNILFALFAVTLFKNEIFIPFAIISGLGFYIFIAGIIVLIVGLIKSNIFSRRNCPKCGRKIQFEARVYPYCKNDFEGD